MEKKEKPKKHVIKDSKIIKLGMEIPKRPLKKKKKK